MSELLSQQESAATHDQRGKFARGNPLAWKPGQSGNPSGRPKGASFATALAKQAATPVADREEMAKIARSIGLDPEQAQNIDVVAVFIYAPCRARSCVPQPVTAATPTITPAFRTRCVARSSAAPGPGP